MIGAVVCCAACIAGDNLQDLKAGYIVGATPWRQQVMLAIGSVSCALVMAPMLNLLAHSYGIGAAHARASAVARGAAGESHGVGREGYVRRRTALEHDRDRRACIGVAIIVLDQILKARKAPFRVPVLAAAIGIYLPLETMVPIFLGGLLNYLVTRTLRQGPVRRGSREAQPQGHVVRGRPHHRRSADGHRHRRSRSTSPTERRRVRAAGRAADRRRDRRMGGPRTARRGRLVDVQRRPSGTGRRSDAPK